MNSAGSAMKENETYTNSLEGKLNALQGAWQSFARNTINSDFVKNILEATTGMIKFVDSVGGAVPLLTTLVSLFSILKAGSVAKGITDITKKFTEMKTIITTLGGGFKGFQLYLAGIKTTEEAAAISTNTLALSMMSLMSIISAGTAVISLIVMGVNAYKNAQKEATEAAIKESQTASENIKTKKKQKEVTEEEIKKLEEEKKAYEDSSKSKDKKDNFVQTKNEEIRKRQENITNINKEIDSQLKLREAAARSMKTNKADSTGLGWNQLYGASTEDKADKFRENIKSINKELKGAGENTGAYKRKLEDLVKEYEKQAQVKENNNEDTEVETKTIQALNKEIEHNSKKYEEDSKVADEFYDILLNGGTISKENIEWLKKFKGLTDDQIKSLREGVDVENDTTTATKNQVEETSNLTEKQKELLDQYNNVTKAIKSKNEAIDKEQKSYKTLQSAVDEYNESGYLSIDTLQSLLSLDNEHLSMLSFQNGQLVLNTTSLDNMTDALIAQRVEQLQTAATQDLYNLALGNTSSLSDTAKTAISNLDSKTSGIGSTFSSQVKGINEFTAAIVKAKAAAGADTNVSDYEAKANAIISSYQDVYKKITTLGKGTTRAAGTSGKRHKYTGSGKSKKSGSKSSKEAYKAEVDVLYKYENALDNAKDAVDRLNDALKNTDNFNEREKYLKQLISATKDEIEATNDLRKAQTRQINDYIKQLRKQGFQISYNSKTNELNINNMERLGKFSGDTAKNLEKMIKKIQDLNKDNRSLSGSVRDLNADIEDFNKQLEELPTEKLEKFNELMEKFQQSRLDQIQNQIDDIENEMKNDPRLKALEAQIEALEKQNDELDSQKELEEKILAVEQAKDKLANQRKNKTIQIYRENQRMGKIMPSSIVICCVISNYIGQSPEMDKTEVRLIYYRWRF